MKTAFSTLLCLSLAFALSGSARAADVPSGDKMFAQKAAMGGMCEVEAGKLAADKGAAQEVKDFGSMMVEDHGKANDELKSIASSKGIELPAQLDSAHQKVIDNLNRKSGKAFDKAFLAAMTKGHNDADALFSKEAKKGQDEELKSFAGKTDVVIKHHIEMLKDVKSKTK